MILHVLGSCGSGKRTFKRKWFESLHARVLPEIADLHLKLHVSTSHHQLNTPAH